MSFNNKKLDVLAFTTYISSDGELITIFFHNDTEVKRKIWDEKFFSSQELFSIVKSLRKKYEK